MTHKIDLVELYLPDCMVNWAEVTQNLNKLTGFDFLINYGTQASTTLNFDEMIHHYFFDTPVQGISHAALCAYFCNLDLEQSYWIKADPVQYILDISKGFIIPGEFKLDNSKNLINIINQFISQDNLKFIKIDEKNGLISSDKPIDYFSPSLNNIINQQISFDEISGQDKTYWQKLSAELQLLLRQHKTKESDPDGVYFWGAGELPINLPKPKFNKIISNHYSVLGLAKLSGVNFDKLNFSVPLNFEVHQGINILLATQDFSYYFRSGDSAEFIKLSMFFDKILLDLIKLVKNNKLKKLVLNTGNNTYQLTKCNMIKSYFMRFFKIAKSPRSQVRDPL